MVTGKDRGGLVKTRRGTNMLLGLMAAFPSFWPITASNPRASLLGR